MEGTVENCKRIGVTTSETMKSEAMNQFNFRKKYPGRFSFAAHGLALNHVKIFALKQRQLFFFHFIDFSELLDA